MSRPVLKATGRLSTTKGVGRSFALAAVVGLAMTAAHAHSYKFADLVVGHLWAPSPQEGAEAVPVYGPILNQGDTAARLVGASTPIADRVRLRVQRNGEVYWPDSLELRPERPFALAAWREHLWVSGLRERLKKGDTFDLTLDFSDRGRLTATVVVEEAHGP